MGKNDLKKKKKKEKEKKDKVRINRETQRIGLKLSTGDRKVGKFNLTVMVLVVVAAAFVVFYNINN